MGPASDRWPVRVQRVITKGSFVASCRSALEDNTYYPSWQVFIDVNGDGRCSAGDVGLDDNSFFGWDAPIDVMLDASASWSDVADLPAQTGPLSVNKPNDAFCAAYFPWPT